MSRFVKINALCFQVGHIKKMAKPDLQNVDLDNFTLCVYKQKCAVRLVRV